MKIDLAKFWQRVVEACETDQVSAIAKKAGTTQQAIYKSQSKGNLPSVETVINLCHSTGVSVHWLLLGEGPKERAVLVGIKEGELDLADIRKQALLDFFIAESVKLAVPNQAQVAPRKKHKQ